jgi:hypothetical protein
LASETPFSNQNPQKESFFRKILTRLASLPLIVLLIKYFYAFDRRVDGAGTFFFKHYGKTRFMVAMSKKSQYLGIERLWEKGPKAFMYFFLFYLIRDTILYIIIPIWFAKATS